MAMTQAPASNDAPWWPKGRTPLAVPPAKYGAYADELVVRFHDWSATPVATSFLNDPRHDYVGIIEKLDTGRIVGIQIDALEAAGVKDHPHWAALLQPIPSREAVAALVAEVRALFDRYGVPPDDEGTEHR